MADKRKQMLAFTLAVALACGVPLLHGDVLAIQLCQCAQLEHEEGARMWQLAQRVLSHSQLCQVWQRAQLCKLRQLQWRSSRYEQFSTA